MYSVEYTDEFRNQFKKLDRSVQKIVKKWIEKHIIDCEDTRVFGKGLTADKKGYWRYRVGDYRIIAEIEDDRLIIIAVSIAHRSEVYR